MKDKEKLTALDMYVGLLERKFKADVSPDFSVKNDAEMRIEYDRIVTSKSIKKFFVLSQISMYMPTDLIALTRQLEMENSDEYINSGVSINFVLKMEPYHIPWNDRSMQIRTAVWDQDIKQAEEDMPDTHFIGDKEKSIMHQNTWIEKSWKYFKDRCSKKHSTPVMQLYVELCAKSSTPNAFKNLKQVEIAFLDDCAARGYVFKKVKGNLWDFMRLYSPISAGNPRLENSLPKFPITDEIFSNIVDYTPGALSQTDVLLGIDIDTGKFVYKDFVRSFGEAEVLVIAAITGGGKSYFTKSIVSNILIGGFSILIMDRDGEYIPMAKYFGGTVISMGRGQGKYFDSTIISELTGDENLDSGLLIDSVNATTSIFNILADAECGMNSTELAIFNDAYNNLYYKYGIDRNDRSTWSNSKELTFHKLYNEIFLLSKDDEYYNRYTDRLDDFIDKLRVFFEENGINSYLFKEPISIEEVFSDVDGKAPLVVLHMDLKDEGDSKGFDQATLIKLATTSYLSDMILNHNKRYKKFTFDIIEEFQRYLYNDNAKGIVVTKATGGRKRNAITTIITNNPGELANSLVSDKALQAIRANITSSIIGKIAALDDIAPICNNLGLMHCDEDMQIMFEDPDIYKHCFIAKLDGKEGAIIKAVVPPAMRDTALFQTRDTKNEKSY